MSSKLRTIPRRGAVTGVRCTLFDLGSLGIALATLVIPRRTGRQTPEAGRGGAIRTPDRRFWRPLLYQLSYAPVQAGPRNPAADLIARLQIPWRLLGHAHPVGRAREDQVARQEAADRRQAGDQLRHRKDHLSCPGVLNCLTVNATLEMLAVAVLEL